MRILNFMTAASVKAIALSFAMLAVTNADNWSLDPADPDHHGIELMVVSVLITNNLTGTLTGKLCEDCELMQFRITPDTRYLVSGGQPAPLELARGLTGKDAAIAYRISTKEATQIASF